METHNLLIRIPPREIAFLTFTLESYEGIASVRTINRREGLVELMVSPLQVDDVRELLKGLAADFQIEFVDAPLK